MFTLPANSSISKTNVEEAIKFNEENRSRYTKLKDYYLGKHGITSRTKVPSLKNNQVVVNHASYITDVNVGFLLGNPIEYQSLNDEGIKKDTPIDNTINSVTEEYKRQSIAKLDHKLATDLSKYGRAYEYIYSNENSEVVSQAIDVRNCIVVYDDTLEHKELFAVIYTAKDADGKRSVTAVDSKHIYEFNSDLTSSEITNHAFGKVPVIEHVNNDDYMGDYEQVLTLIDAYNLLQSDRVNDKEQLVDAILMIYGFTLTSDQLKSLKSNRVMSAPSKNEGAQAEYLIKTLNETDTDVLRSVIEADIHKISKTPNLADQNFVGNASGVAIRYKLIAFEQSIKNKERYFETGLKKRFQIYNNFLNKKNSSVSIVPIHEIEVIFKRNLPQNDYETSQMILNLETFVDRQTLLGQLSFIKDAQDTVKWKEEEDLAKANVDSPQFGTDEADKGEEEADETDE